MKTLIISLILTTNVLAYPLMPLPDDDKKQSSVQSYTSINAEMKEF